jgi:tRNA pseudouridine55 synthase
MAPPPKKYEAIHGIFLLDKPEGVTSNAALQRVKRILAAKKAGHLGNLDPIATGLLPICLGEATKFSQFVLEADKAYRVTARLGVETTTGDTEGEVLSTAPVQVDEANVRAVLASFLGEIEQTPPMHSAVKHQGKALYHYARAGVVVPRTARKITIHQIEFQALENDQLHFWVSCSKGTYVRVLVEEIGKMLGCGAHVSSLARTHAGCFSLEQAITLDELEAMDQDSRLATLLPTDALLPAFPRLDLDSDHIYYLFRGQEVWKSQIREKGFVRLYDMNGLFLGLGEITSSGRIAPKRLVRI